PVTTELQNRLDVFPERTEGWFGLPATGLTAIARQPFLAESPGSPEPVERLSESIPGRHAISPATPIWMAVEHGRQRRKEPRLPPLGAPVPRQADFSAAQAKFLRPLCPERGHSVRQDWTR